MMKKIFWLIAAIFIFAGCKSDKLSLRDNANQTVIRKPDGMELLYIKAQDALDAAQNGDIVLLGPGRHQGPLFFKSSGVTLRGERGSSVSGMVSSWRPQWKEEPLYGYYAWSARIPFETRAVSINGRTMLDVPEALGRESVIAVHRFGMGTAGRDVLKACFTYLSKSKIVVVSFPNREKPDRYRIEAAPVGSAAVVVSGVDNCIVENIIIQSGDCGIKLEKTSGSIVRNCLVTGDNCIILGQGVSDCRIIDNDLTLTPDFFNSEKGIASIDPWIAASFENKRKWAVLSDDSGTGNEIAHNYIYNVYCGIGHSSKAIGCHIHDNRIDLCGDKPVAVSNGHVENNFITRSRFPVNNVRDLKTIPSGPVSGLWKIADIFYPLHERRAVEFYPKFERLLRPGKDGKIEFYAVNILHSSDLMRMRLMRSPANTTDGYSVKIFSDRGELVLSTNGNPAKCKALSDLNYDFPSEKNRRLRVVINDSQGSEWYFPKCKFFVPALSVKTPTRIAKYDDSNSYKLFYNAPRGTQSIALFMDDLSEGAYASVESPGGRVTTLHKSGTVVTPEPGRYTIRLFFKGEMTFSIGGPSDTAVIAPSQEMENSEYE